MEDESKISAFKDICDFFNLNNIMTIEDFNDICDYYNKEELEEEE